MLILKRKSFWNNFDSTGNKLTDLYDSASSAGLPSFWIIMICSTFHWSEFSGKKPRLSTALLHYLQYCSWVIYFITVFRSIFSTLLVMRLQPGAFFGFRWFITAFTSLIKRLVGISCVTGMVSTDSSLFSSSCIVFLGLGLETLERCSAKVFPPHFWSSSRPDFLLAGDVSALLQSFGSIP